MAKLSKQARECGIRPIGVGLRYAEREVEVDAEKRSPRKGSWTSKAGGEVVRL